MKKLVTLNIWRPIAETVGTWDSNCEFLSKRDKKYYDFFCDHFIMQEIDFEGMGFTEEELEKDYPNLDECMVDGWCNAIQAVAEVLPVVCYGDVEQFERDLLHAEANGCFDVDEDEEDNEND